MERDDEEDEMPGGGTSGTETQMPIPISPILVDAVRRRPTTATACCVGSPSLHVLKQMANGCRAAPRFCSRSWCLARGRR